EKDLAEIPDNVKEGLNIIPVATVDQVLARALTRPLTPIEWTEEDEEAHRAHLSRGDGAPASDGAPTH
ncbi:MAG: S16 family serine protease, partial [Pseudomonadota bacterium]